jgi:hypothetical protein
MPAQEVAVGLRYAVGNGPARALKGRQLSDIDLGDKVRYQSDGYQGEDPQGDLDQYDGATALVVNRGKGLLMDGRMTWVIQLYFDNGDLIWVADHDVTKVEA